MAVIFLVVIPALFAVIGLVVGLVKGFTEVQTWAGEYLVSALLTISVGVILKATGVGSTAAGIVVIIAAVLLLLLCIGLSGLFKRIIRHALERRDDEMRSYGAVGVINRIWGGVVLAIKGMMVAFIIIVPVFIVLDLAHITGLQSSLGGLLGSGLWLNLKAVAFDFIILGFINIAVRHGFSNGISSSLWSLLVFGFAVGAGFIAYNLVFNSGLFNDASSAFANTVGGWFGGKLSLSEDVILTIARWIITAGLFVLLLVVVFLISFFVSRVLTFARLGSAFYVADGILGALVMLIITAGIILFIGYIVQPIYDLDFMQPFTSYFARSVVARYFYQDNLLVSMGMRAIIPLREWLTFA